MAIKFEYLIDRPEEVPTVIDWWYTIWGDVMGPDVASNVAQMRSTLSKTELPISILATIDGVPVGSAALKTHELYTLYPDKKYWLGSVFVDEKSRGEGIASKLTMRLVEIAQQRGLPHLYLQTLNLQGGLYAKLGWLPQQQISHMGEEILVMKKTLESV